MTKKEWIFSVIFFSLVMLVQSILTGENICSFPSIICSAFGVVVGCLVLHGINRSVYPKSESFEVLLKEAQGNQE